MSNINISAVCNNSLRENEIYTKGYFKPGKFLYKHLESPNINYRDIIKWMWQICNYASCENRKDKDILYNIDPTKVYITGEGDIIKDTIFSKSSFTSDIDSSTITANCILNIHNTIFEHLNMKRMDILRKRQILIFNMICNRYINSFDMNDTNDIVKATFTIIDTLCKFIETGIVEEIVDKFFEWD